MKKIILLSSFLLAFSANAQDPDKMRERMHDRLNLDAEQVVEFDAIMDARRKQIEEINKNVDAQLLELLSDEQYAEWKSMQERRGKPRRRR